MTYRPSNLIERKRIYGVLPKVRVQPLQIAERDLDVSRILTLMGADDMEVCLICCFIETYSAKTIPSQHVPLYMHKALSVLRELGPERFSYQGKHFNGTIFRILIPLLAFKTKMASTRLDGKQKDMLQLRFDVLDTYVKGATDPVSSWFKDGRLVIIDLTDAFVDRKCRK